MPSYNLTRTGFTFLVMGFTGAKASAFKIAYIARFDAIEDYMVEKLGDAAARKAVSQLMRSNNPPLTGERLRLKEVRDKANRQRYKRNRLDILNDYK